MDNLLKNKPERLKELVAKKGENAGERQWVKESHPELCAKTSTLVNGKSKGKKG